MFHSTLKTHLEFLLDDSIVHQQPLSGGDINDSYLIQTNRNNYVVKTNKADAFSGMFEAEKEGLLLLSNSNTIKTPRSIHVGSINNTSFLVLEYISQGAKHTNFWEEFGIQLAQLHKKTVPYFGLDSDNYIGSLPQYNTQKDNAVLFYIEQRLVPQLDLAGQHGFAFKNLTTFFNNIESEIPKEAPSLIHGDLWSGNYLVSKNGSPYLIDPAVAFVPREMDIAMMHLFGGFHNTLFDSYEEVFRLTDGWKKRIELWQLYYLLVHLNIFGSGYLNQVKRIINKYS